jgi:Ca-activated chloride channel family protein
MKVTNWNINFWEYTFLSPNWLWLLLLAPLLFLFLRKREKNRKGDWKFTGNTVQQLTLTEKWIPRIQKLILGANVLVYCLFILAMAKPYHPLNEQAIQQQFKKGIDILLAIDVSISMQAMDFEPNRLEASKRVAKEFIDGRPGDRIGLVAYAGEAYTACPATLDHKIVKEQIDQLGQENLLNGTAIGTGLGTAVSRLRSDSLPSKVIILLTDGSNNAGEIDPITAAELARVKNIRVYTIGVGTNGEAPTPVLTPFGVRFENIPVEIDEETLQKIASTTGGSYFRATDEKSLEAIYKEIEKLEKRRIADNRYAPEEPSTPLPFLNWAFLIAALSYFTNRYFFRFYA